MIMIFGPKNSRYAYTGTPCPHNDLVFGIIAKTLAEAIHQYEVRYEVTITPHLEKLEGEKEFKYFQFMCNKAHTWQLVDIHIFRAGAEICPKQNLSFELCAGDIVEIGELIC